MVYPDPWRLGLSFSVAALCGCAPALSSFQPAHVAPKHHVQVEIGADVSIPTGTIADTIDAATELVDVAKTQELTEAQKKVLFDAGVGLTLNPPSVAQHIGVGFTAVDNFEVNLRYSVSAIRLGARYQILSKEKNGVDLTAGFAAGRYVFEIPYGDALPLVTLEDFTRWQFEFPISIGTHGSWYRVWGGPRILFTTFGTELTLGLPEIPGVTPEKTELASFSGTGAYYGGQIGAALGYKYVFFGVELTMAELLSGGELDAFGKKALDVDLNSFIVYPAFALMGEF